MLKRLINKIRHKKLLLQDGELPHHVFDNFFLNKKLTTAEYHNSVLSNDEANLWLFQQVTKSEPFFATRFGGFELGMVSNLLFNQLIGKNYWSAHSKKMLARDQSWNGDVKFQQTFYENFLKAIPHINGLGIWYNHGEQVLANYLCPNATLFELIAYEPYFYKQPWTLALKNRKVLVIHPYTESIVMQYQKRKLLFKQEVLPEFEIITYKPFSSFGDDWKNYPDMQATLDKMINDVKAIDFDISLIACGPQGLPLGAAIKQMGKQAIHVGGALQLFFGILGKRWEEPGRPQQHFFNEHWVRPLDTEIPKDARALKFSDEGCYW